MQLLSMGYWLPEDTDPSEGIEGVGWWESLKANAQRQNDHNHDGVNSQPLSTTALTKYTSTLLPAGWIADALGGYYQDVVVPAAISGATAPYNDINFYSLSFLLGVNGDADYGTRVYPTVTRLSSTTFRVNFGDNTRQLTVLYV